MANGRSQGLQVAVIIFAILTVISGVVAAVSYKNMSDQSADFTIAKEAARKAKDTATLATNDLRLLKRLIRSDYETMSFAELAQFGAGDVLEGGAIFEDLNKLQAESGTEPYRDYSHALQALHDRVDNLTTQLNNLQTDNVNMEIDSLARNQLTQAEINVHQEAKQKAEEDLEGERTAFVKSIAEKERETAEYRLFAEIAMTDKEQQGLDFDQKNQENATVIAQQRSRIDLLNEELSAFKESSFERADGQVVYVSSRLGLVWINLGEGDNLPKQQTFSVYSSSELNVAKKRKKADIEITRILRGAHLSEARITNYGSTAGDPILEGDVVYTPLWSPGRQRRFALAGFFDLDGDGQSDRQTVRDVILNGGGVIVAEVLDDGQIKTRNKGIDINTKYLILGESPEVTATGFETEASINIREVIKGISELTKQARDAGVRIIGVEEFLDLVGYQPHMRLVKPGTLQTSSRRPYRQSFGERGRTRSANAGRYQNGLRGGLPSRARAGGY